MKDFNFIELNENAAVAATEILAAFDYDNFNHKTLGEALVVRDVDLIIKIKSTPWKNLVEYYATKIRVWKFIKFQLNPMLKNLKNDMSANT